MLEGQVSDAFPEPVTLSIAELEADPHGVFRRYRAATPFIMREDGSFIVLRSKDVEQLVKDPRLRQGETEFPRLRGITEGVLFDFFESGMLTSNGEVHRRRRAPFSRTFALRMVTDLRPHIRKVAESLVDSWYPEGEVDLVDRYAALIPAHVISRILGLPSADIPRFTGLVYQVSRFLSYTITPDDLPAIEAAARELRDYVESLLNRRRGGPVADFLGAYLADAEQRGDLSAAEIVTQIVILIIGGTDTTRVAMAMQVALLLQHREQWNAVCRDPSLIPAAVMEALRYEPSVASVGRVTRQAITLDGQILPGNRFVALSTLSAMRDEAVYAEPDKFDIHRTDHPRWHPVFGNGPHRCLGEALARVELEEGLAALTTRIPRLQLAGEPPRLRGHVSIRRIAAMRVNWPS
jgi:cytochrome P450 family 103